MEGECTVCRETVSGQIVSAAGKKFHPDCFVCVQCLMPFPGGKFFESMGKLYCETDYQTCFGNRCGRCGESIVGRCVTALDMKWHPEHFTCDMCGIALAGTSFVKRLGRPYCKDCVTKLREQEQEAQRNMCDKCKKPIANRNEMLVIKRQKFHAFHFTCANLTCRKDLDGDAKELDGKFYCPSCHSKALVATCAACHRPIEGRSITALGKQFHPEHFVCAKCEKPFAGGLFYEHQGQAYCEQHFNEITGTTCGRCGRPSSGRVVDAIGRKFCEHHFMCIGCDTNITLQGAKFLEWDSKPMCKSCYGSLPSSLQRKLGKYAELERKAQKEALKG